MINLTYELLKLCILQTSILDKIVTTLEVRETDSVGISTRLLLKEVKLIRDTMLAHMADIERLLLQVNHENQKVES